MRIESHRFGTIEARDADLLHFDGLPGFPDMKRFALVGHDRESPFAWLVSADDPELAFVVADPWQFFPDYRPELEAGQIHAVGAKGEEELHMLAIASVRDGEIRLNLAAPLLLNPGSRRATQVILATGDYATNQLVRPPREDDGG